MQTPRVSVKSSAAITARPSAWHEPAARRTRQRVACVVIGVSGGMGVKWSWKWR